MTTKTFGITDQKIIDEISYQNDFISTANVKIRNIITDSKSPTFTKVELHHIAVHVKNIGLCEAKISILEELLRECK